jgi:hypothetical protein
MDSEALRQRGQELAELNDWLYERTEAILVAYQAREITYEEANARIRAVNDEHASSRALIIGEGE